MSARRCARSRAYNRDGCAARVVDPRYPRRDQTRMRQVGDDKAERERRRKCIHAQAYISINRRGNGSRRMRRAYGMARNIVSVCDDAPGSATYIRANEIRKMQARHMRREQALCLSRRTRGAADSSKSSSSRSATLLCALRAARSRFRECAAAAARVACCRRYDDLPVSRRLSPVFFAEAPPIFFRPDAVACRRCPDDPPPRQVPRHARQIQTNRYK